MRDHRITQIEASRSMWSSRLVTSFISAKHRLGAVSHDQLEALMLTNV